MQKDLRQESCMGSVPVEASEEPSGNQTEEAEKPLEENRITQGPFLKQGHLNGGVYDRVQEGAAQ